MTIMPPQESPSNRWATPGEAEPPKEPCPHHAKPLQGCRPGYKPNQAVAHPGWSRVLFLLHMQAPTWPVSCHGAAVFSSAFIPERFTSCMPDAQRTEICSLQGRDVSQPWKDLSQVTAPMGRGEAKAKHFHDAQGLTDPCYASLGINRSAVSANVLGGSWSRKSMHAPCSKSLAQ